jgi:hypothetical protein
VSQPLASGPRTDCPARGPASLPAGSCRAWLSMCPGYATPYGAAAAGGGSLTVLHLLTAVPRWGAELSVVRR